MTDTYGYTAYGGDNGGASTTYNPYRYTGTYLDGATGLYQMGARYYQAESASFTQADPHPTQMMGQSHAYAAGDPANNTDPTGLVVDTGFGGGYLHPCSGWYRGRSVASIWYQRRADGRLTWNFRLTNGGRKYYGSGGLVTVWIKWATVNGGAINPPYRPHTEWPGYDFHGSIYKYDWWGPAPGSGTIRTGDILMMNWGVQGNNGTDGGRYDACRVGRPGA
jgi:RHS repeat-associated protein